MKRKTDRDTLEETTPEPAACGACGAALQAENARVADGCPCNSARGVNHGLVPADVCTCSVCDPNETGSSRAAAAEKLAVETWAERKGMLPELFAGGELAIPPNTPGVIPGRGFPVSLVMSGRVAPRHNPKFGPYAAARAQRQWVQGQEVTEEEFDRACDEAMTHPIR